MGVINFEVSKWKVKMEIGGSQGILYERQVLEGALMNSIWNMDAKMAILICSLFNIFKLNNFLLCYFYRYSWQYDTTDMVNCKHMLSQQWLV